MEEVNSTGNIHIDIVERYGGRLSGGGQSDVSA
jgi:hypothetical protein